MILRINSNRFSGLEILAIFHVVNVLINFIDNLNRAIGRAISWLSLGLVIVIVLDVFFRYVFSITSAASFELEWHLFAALFLLSAGWAYQEDKHVRVDVFYQHFSWKKKAWVELLGCLLLLIPFCYIGFSEGLQFVINAYEIGEGSPDPGGLPARYIIKSAIPAGFLLLGLQGISGVLKSIQTIVQR